MDLEIQTQHVDLDPSLRDLVDRAAERLAARYPELLRMHVTLRHGGHHRHGAEEVALIGNAEGRTVRADKQGEVMKDVLHEAFDALASQLDHHHHERRRVTKSPGPRAQGSIKRIFRDGGYGFIHHAPGRDVYFHRRALHGLRFEDLEPGTPVEFEIERAGKGLQAPQVFPVGDRSRA
jgi:cold shock CspA family protein